MEKSNTNVFYIVERRKSDSMIEDANCFLSDSIYEVINWINNNKDFDRRKFFWYWAIIKIIKDEPFGGEIFKYFDRDGNELEYQPITEGTSKSYNPSEKLEVNGNIRIGI